VPQIADLRDLGLEALNWQYLGTLNGRNCYSAELDDEAQPPGGWTFQGLRHLYNLLPEPQFLLAGRAVQIVDWDRTHRYCGRCGVQTHDKTHERAKECPNCGLISYPRISPAIIVLVERNDGRLLLARAHRHPPGFYSVLAGFVEPGETLEEAVVREIREEVGIEVENIRYFGSQPWPFPNSLMIAFTCRYVGGEIRLEEEELEDAGWYTVDNMPRVPPKLSIARQMIDTFVAKHS
jgi:NAD+ diphosphatase